MSDPHRHPSVHEPGQGWDDCCPVIFAEALFDHVPDGSRVLGGAPFNVAWHLRGFKADPLLVTAVGEEREGEEILRCMADWGLNTSGVQIHSSRTMGLDDDDVGGLSGRRPSVLRRR